MSRPLIAEFPQQVVFGRLVSPSHVLRNGKRNWSDSTNYSKYYRIMNLPEDCDQEQLRQSYLNLVKKYHPDSGSPEADSVVFQEVENAYRNLQKKMSKERYNHQQCAGEYGLYYTEKEEAQEFDIKHTAPQHRQYLSYGGYGAGTPAQREKQYRKYRAVTAAENVYNHRINKLANQMEDGLLVKDKKEAKKIKTRYGIDRLVEDLIQESMAKGEFDNLSGKGKPLQQQNYNPYVDLVTHKLNQVLIENGFTPEWITLQKEIVQEKTAILESMSSDRSYYGPNPLDSHEANQWISTVKKHEKAVKELNSKIVKYNLLVPILEKQMFLFNLEKEANKILVEGKSENADKNNVGKNTLRKIEEQKTSNETGDQNLLSLLTSLFR